LIALVQQVATDLNDVKVRLQNLEMKFEQSSYDTKPLWERALAEILEIRNELRQSNKENSATLKEINRKLNRIQAELSTTITRQDELEDRLDHIEPKAS
jgi:hypothetical protein